MNIRIENIELTEAEARQNIRNSFKIRLARTSDPDERERLEFLLKHV